MSERREEVHSFLDDNNVGWILFDAPGANILTRKAFERIAEILEQYRKMSVVALIFIGARRNFSGGLRLKYMREIQNSCETADEKIGYFYEVGRMIREFPAPTIMAIEDGVCFGVAIELAGLVDYVVAMKENASTILLGARAINAGFMLGLGVSWRFAQKIGVSSTARFLINKDTTNASTACNIGIVDALLPGNDSDGFKKEVSRFAEMAIKRTITPKMFPRIIPEFARLLTREEITYLSSGCSLETVMSTLESLDAIAPVENFQEAMVVDKFNFTRVFLSENAREGVRAILKNEQPNFVGGIV